MLPDFPLGEFHFEPPTQTWLSRSLVVAVVVTLVTLIVLAVASRGQAQKMPAGLKAVFAPGGA